MQLNANPFARREYESLDGSSRKSQKKMLLIGGICVVAVLMLSSVSFGGTLTAQDGQELVAAPAAPKDHLAECTRRDFTKRTLKLIHEAPVIGLLNDRRGESKFEASDIIKVGSKFYTVSDDVWSIVELDENLRYNDQQSRFIDPIERPAPPADPKIHTENGFEALFYDEGTETFSGVVEAVVNQDDDAKYHAEVKEFRLNDGVYSLLRTCIADYQFEDSNLGFEGAIHVTSQGKDYMLGLCESNYCAGGAKGRETGHGRLIALERVMAPNGDCTYETRKEIELPAGADFLDYSAIAYNPQYNKIAITSQESSMLWVGEFDVEKLEAGEGKAYMFPRDNDCNTVYCNVEGISFLSGDMLVAASDKMKSKGRQDFRCRDKDQSVHIFAVP